MTKMNENTGLPELPDGYFWRVENYDGGIHGVPMVYLWLMRGTGRKLPKNRILAKLALWWDENYEARAVDYYCLGIAEVFKESVERGITFDAAMQLWILITAKRLVKDYEQALDIKAAQEAAKKFVGNYPPKKLGE